METLVLKRTRLLSFADVVKQKGYLAGMILSYIFYKGLEYCEIMEKQTQVYYLHWLLLGIQILMIVLVVKAFRSR